MRAAPHSSMPSLDEGALARRVAAQPHIRVPAAAVQRYLQALGAWVGAALEAGRAVAVALLGTFVPGPRGWTLHLDRAFLEALRLPAPAAPPVRRAQLLEPAVLAAECGFDPGDARAVHNELLASLAAVAAARTHETARLRLGSLGVLHLRLAGARSARFEFAARRQTSPPSPAPSSTPTQPPSGGSPVQDVPVPTSAPAPAPVPGRRPLPVDYETIELGMALARHETTYGEAKLGRLEARADEQTRGARRAEAKQAGRVQEATMRRESFETQALREAVEAQAARDALDFRCSPATRDTRSSYFDLDRTVEAGTRTMQVCGRGFDITTRCLPPDTRSRWDVERRCPCCRQAFVVVRQAE